MTKFANRAKMSISSTGTGNVTLNSAVAGYRTFAAAGIVDSDQIRYIIEDGAAFEIGIGLMSSSATVMARTVEESSNSDNALNLTSAAKVLIGLTSNDLGPTVYANLNDLIAATGMAVGDMALVTATNKMYVYLAAGWWLLATLTNTSPTAISGVSATYNLAQDGTATVITLSSTDPEGFPLTYSHTVSSGSLGSTATVAQGTGANTNVFTITPSTNSAHEGTFSLTFSVSDGNSVSQAVTAITLSFVLTWSNSQSQPIISWVSSTYTGSGTRWAMAVPIANSITTIPTGVGFYWFGGTPTSSTNGSAWGGTTIVNQSVTFNGQTFNKYVRTGANWSAGDSYWIRFGGASYSDSTWALGTGVTANSQGWIRNSTAVSNNASGINTP